MSRSYKIQISKGEGENERRIVVNATEIETYIADGWTAETEPYISEPIMLKPVDTIADVDTDAVNPDTAVNIASDADKAADATTGANNTADVAEEVKMAVDDDLLVE